MDPSSNLIWATYIDLASGALKSGWATCDFLGFFFIKLDRAGSFSFPMVSPLNYPEACICMKSYPDAQPVNPKTKTFNFDPKTFELLRCCLLPLSQFFFFFFFLFTMKAGRASSSRCHLMQRARWVAFYPETGPPVLVTGRGCWKRPLLTRNDAGHDEPASTAWGRKIRSALCGFRWCWK
jgi:hypothetical protein